MTRACMEINVCTLSQVWLTGITLPCHCAHSGPNHAPWEAAGGQSSSAEPRAVAALGLVLLR